MKLKNSEIFAQIIFIFICSFFLGSCASAGLYKIKTAQHGGIEINRMLLATENYNDNKRTMEIVHVKAGEKNAVSLQFSRLIGDRHLRYINDGFGWKLNDYFLSGKVKVIDDIVLETLTNVSRDTLISGKIHEVFTVPVDEETLKKIFSKKEYINFYLITVKTDGDWAPSIESINSITFWDKIWGQDYTKIAGHLNEFYQIFYGKPLVE